METQNNLLEVYGIDLEPILQKYMFEMVTTQTEVAIKHDINAYISQLMDDEFEEYVTDVRMSPNSLDVTVNPSGLIHKKMRDRADKITNVLNDKYDTGKKYTEYGVKMTTSQVISNNGFI